MAKVYVSEFSVLTPSLGSGYVGIPAGNVANWSITAGSSGSSSILSTQTFSTTTKVARIFSDGYVAVALGVTPASSLGGIPIDAKKDIIVGVVPGQKLSAVSLST